MTRARTPPPSDSTTGSGTITPEPPGCGASSLDSKRCIHCILRSRVLAPLLCYEAVEVPPDVVVSASGIDPAELRSLDAVHIASAGGARAGPHRGRHVRQA